MTTPDHADTIQDATNWHAVAACIAAGGDVAAAARAAGCDEAVVHRKLGADGLLNALVAAYRRIEAQGGTVATAANAALGREVRSGNLKTIMWLADRVRLLPTEAAGGGVADEGPLDALTQDELAELAALEERAAGLG